MTARIVRLGDPRESGEGLRLGSVRRPPRGVPKAELARRDFYDLWLPLLSPSAELVKQAHAAQQPDSAPGAWAAFARRFRAEMRAPDASQMLDVLAALSRHADFSLGCYCKHEARCHRSLLRALLAERGAVLAD